MGTPGRRDMFWSTVPRRGRILFFGAVFCVFAPAIILPMRTDGSPATAVVIAMFTSGLIGMFWAMAFTRSLWFLAAALSLQALTMLGFSRMAPVWAWPRVTGFDMAGILSVVMVALGYALFIRFIGTEGKRSIRERTELALAKRIHATLVPPVAFEAEGWRVFGRSDPSTEVGGDLMTSSPRDGGIDIDLGDVTGHGVRAGVVMAMTRSAVHMARARGESLAGVLAETNEMLTNLTDPGMFVTFVSVRGARDGSVRYALAGHLPILHWRSADRVIARLENDSLPLGIVAGEAFPERTTRVLSGDLLVILTDGLIEVTDRTGAQLGLEGFERLLASAADLPLEGLFEHLVASVRAHGPIADDQTLVLARYAG